MDLSKVHVLFLQLASSIPGGLGMRPPLQVLAETVPELVLLPVHPVCSVQRLGASLLGGREAQINMWSSK